MARWAGFVSFFLLAFAMLTGDPARADGWKVVSFQTISKNGGRVDWDPSGSDWIAFDKKNPDGYFDVYLVRPDGTGLRSITSGTPGVWQRHNGNPCWHPSGKYLVFQSEHPTHYRVQDKWAPDPGVGCYNELWITDLNTREYWQLTSYEVKKRLFDGKVALGVLNPLFYDKGSRLLWTERYERGGEWGKWRIRSARFLVDPVTGPRLEDFRILFQPSAGMGNYVTCKGVTPDSRKLLLAGNLTGPDHKEFGMDLYLYDLPTGSLKDLTNDPNDWTEGAALSPDGDRIIYASGRGYPPDPNPKGRRWWLNKARSEYWIMNMDGSGKKQVTHLNVPGHLEYSSLPVIVADCSWSPDGRRLAATIGKDYGTKDEAHRRLESAVFTFKRILVPK